MEKKEAKQKVSRLIQWLSKKIIATGLSGISPLKEIFAGFIPGGRVTFCHLGINSPEFSRRRCRRRAIKRL